MEELDGKTAVVTGAASGIGLALARRLGAEGMRVVLADVEDEALARAAVELAAAGVASIAVRTDVSRGEDVEALAQRATEAFGAVHLVCNNAGVFAGGNSWEVSLADWEWILGVNLWGVIHGLRTFVPRLLAHGEPAHVVNTASMAGLMSNPFAAPYTVSKHAVVALSEVLYHELTLNGSKVGVSVLCPEAVATRIGEAERNRPGGASEGDAETPARALVRTALQQAVGRGLAPEVMADRVVRAVRERRFYVLSEDDWRRAAELRSEDLRLARNPTFAPPSA
jgi:NAD(P)-dependent dehydrogenase (short-subunit alcohol dehydrogenase family)